MKKSYFEVLVLVIIVLMVGVAAFELKTFYANKKQSNSESVSPSEEIKQEVPQGVLPHGAESKYLKMKSAGFVSFPVNNSRPGMSDTSYSLVITNNDELKKLKHPTYIIYYQNPSGKPGQFEKEMIFPNVNAGQTSFVSKRLYGFQNGHSYLVIVQVEVDYKVVDTLKQEIYLEVDAKTQE